LFAPYGDGFKKIIHLDTPPGTAQRADGQTKSIIPQIYYSTIQIKCKGQNKKDYSESFFESRIYLSI
jgi:hypothetical protein